jgi:hypothetical protein
VCLCVCRISKAERLVIDYVERHDLVMTRVPLSKRMTVRCVWGEGCVEGVERKRGRRGKRESEIFEGRKLDTRSAPKWESPPARANGAAT